MTFRRMLLDMAVPAGVLAGAYFLVPVVAELPASVAGLKAYGAYIVIALAASVSLIFRRGRVVLALLTLALAYASYGPLLNDALESFRARTVFAALCIFVPFNLAALSLLEERGTFNLHGAQRLGVIAIEAIFTGWIVFAGKTATTAWAYSPLYETTLLAASPIPQFGLAAMALGFAVCIVAWYLKRAPIDLGFAGTVIAFGVAMNGIALPHVFAVFIAAGALILTIAVLHDTFRMAFRDELTGLPSRRDLNERMMGLGRRYTIAMVDVDRFKNFNDTYGHDLGDQILKMVARKLAEVGGGGTAYRYGGEEFTVLFPGKDLDSAVPHLEALRRQVADYRLALRAAVRPQKTQPVKRQRGAFRASKSESVTISIGVAQRNGKLATPEAVINAADKALYRAKRGGRNQVSR
ncbi:MAG: GGDEF domain-containing protein [Betaproteobacteria bacterium]|nr:GGDEF domain-containing protein [Betaproteobacteria bacterium]